MSRNVNPAQSQDAHSNEWADLLDKDEKILWQGTPEPGVRIEFRSPVLPVFFMFFTGFSVFWMYMASMAGGFFWVFGLLFFFVGVYNLVGIHFWKAVKRKHTYYTLTSKRAIIATAFPFQKRAISFYPVTARTKLEFLEGKYQTVNFAEKERKGQNGTYTTPVGFERLSDGYEVFAHFRQIMRLASND